MTDISAGRLQILYFRDSPNGMHLATGNTSAKIVGRSTVTWREEGMQVTFSAGLSDGSREPLDQLVIAVDEALYKAWQQGENRIVCSGVV